MKTLSFRLALPLLLGAGLSARAQESPYIGESLNYSRLQFGGPARTQSIAGANVALGADFGNLSSNPAGLGLFQKSELNISPGLGLGNADANGTFNLSGTSENQQKNSFHIASFGLVLANRRTDDDTRPWRGGSFALGFSRLTDFNTSFSYQGQVADSVSLFKRLQEPYGYAVGSAGYNGSLDDIDAQYQDGTFTDLDGLAYATYLTDFTQSGNVLDIQGALKRDRSLPVTQQEVRTRRGSLSQFDLGYGGNYKDRLYIGGAIGIVSSNLRQSNTFDESSNAADVTTAFSTLRLNEEVRTEGTGINARIGAIFRANDVLRVGASIQTPTYIQFNETYNTSLSTRFSRPVTITGLSQPVTGNTVSAPAGEYAYTLTTPFRANGGLAVTIGKYGFLTGDIEYVGYGQARLGADTDNANGTAYNFKDENRIIAARYKNTVNLRAGAEARASIFRFRVGYAHYGNPYVGGTLDRSQDFYTAGLGFRQKNFYLDVAGVYTTFDQLYSPYTLSKGQQPEITVNNKRFTTTVTAGFTF